MKHTKLIHSDAYTFHPLQAQSGSLKGQFHLWYPSPHPKTLLLVPKLFSGAQSSQCSPHVDAARTLSPEYTFLVWLAQTAMCPRKGDKRPPLTEA